jgi:signal transduction histidine kinase
MPPGSARAASPASDRHSLGDMTSARSRLTAAYAAALLGTMILFAGALWIARQAWVPSALERPGRQADEALAILVDAAGRGELFIRSTPNPDTAATRDTVTRLTPDVQARLGRLDDYVFVVSRGGGTPLFASDQIRDDQAGIDEFLVGLPQNILNRRVTSALVPLRNEQILVAIRGYPDPGVALAVMVGVPMRSLILGVRELVGTMIAIAPFILLISVAVAYAIAGRALEPIERIIDDLEAITDGRSLHRRLAFPDTSDELARLSATLNAMLSRLETSFDALRRFTADASHELKTPLTVLRADVERAMSPRVSATEQLVALEEALHETARMADLVESLLTLARADEGRFDLHRERIDMEPLVREVFETAQILGEHAGLIVTLPVVDDAVVLGDRTRLRQLFLNLVTNAIKYTPRGGRVDISLSTRLDGVTFTVRDTGIGISAADLPHVFERFYRADRARSRRVQADDGSWSDERGGFGLGLAISQWIARAHGGSLAATSRLGRGSTFVVSLPLEESGAPTADVSVPTDLRPTDEGETSAA